MNATATVFSGVSINCSENNHYWSWTGTNTICGVSEGLKCICGKTIAHYEICKECGTRIMKALSIAEYYGFKTKTNLIKE